MNQPLADRVRHRPTKSPLSSHCLGNIRGSTKNCSIPCNTITCLSICRHVIYIALYCCNNLDTDTVGHVVHSVRQNTVFSWWCHNALLALCEVAVDRWTPLPRRQTYGVLMFSLFLAWTNCCTNSRSPFSGAQSLMPRDCYCIRMETH